MSILELGALGEFLGVFALLATLIYVAIQVRQARHESEKAVLQARYTRVRELSLSVAASQGLSAALVKAEEAVGEAPRAFEAELIRSVSTVKKPIAFTGGTWLNGVTTKRNTNPGTKNNKLTRLAV